MGTFYKNRSSILTCLDYDIVLEYRIGIGANIIPKIDTHIISGVCISNRVNEGIISKSTVDKLCDITEGHKICISTDNKIIDYR